MVDTLIALHDIAARVEAMNCVGAVRTVKGQRAGHIDGAVAVIELFEKIRLRDRCRQNADILIVSG